MTLREKLARAESELFHLKQSLAKDRSNERRAREILDKLRNRDSLRGRLIKAEERLADVDKLEKEIEQLNKVIDDDYEALRKAGFCDFGDVLEAAIAGREQAAKHQTDMDIESRRHVLCVDHRTVLPQDRHWRGLRANRPKRRIGTSAAP